MHQTRKGNLGCVSRTRAQVRDAISKVEVDLPEPDYWSRLQTPHTAASKKRGGKRWGQTTARWQAWMDE
jgi:hypothetical protein